MKLFPVGSRLAVTKGEYENYSSPISVPHLTWIFDQPITPESARPIDNDMEFIEEITFQGKTSYSRLLVSWVYENADLDFWLCNPGFSSYFISYNLGQSWEQLGNERVGQVSGRRLLPTILHKNYIVEASHGWIELRVLGTPIDLSENPPVLDDKFVSFLKDPLPSEVAIELNTLNGQLYLLTNGAVRKIETPLEEKLLIAAWEKPAWRGDEWKTYFTDSINPKRNPHELIVSGYFWKKQTGEENIPLLIASYDAGQSWQYIEIPNILNTENFAWLCESAEGSLYVGAYDADKKYVHIAKLISPGEIKAWMPSIRYQELDWWKGDNVGWINSGKAPWYWLEEMQIWCYHSTNNKDPWCWIPGMGWIVLNEDIFPNVYVFSKGSYLYFGGIHGKQRWFYNYSTRKWETN